MSVSRFGTVNVLVPFSGMVSFRFGQISGRQIDSARPSPCLPDDFFGHPSFFFGFDRSLLIEMVFYHFRERFEQYLERLAIVGTIGFVISSSVVPDFRDGRLDVFGDLVGIARFKKFEFDGFVLDMDGNVSPSEERIENGIPFDIDSVDRMKGDVGHVSGENVPIEIDDAAVGNEPHVVIPIENRIEEEQINDGEVSFEVRERYGFAKGERIVEIKKRRKEDSKEQYEKNPIDDERHVTMAHEKEFRVFGNVFRKEKFVEFVHGPFYGLSIGKPACQGVSV